MFDNKQWTREKLQKWLEKRGEQFDTFAINLSKGDISELAPPFKEYEVCDIDIIQFYKLFFDRYESYLSRIDDETWVFVNCAMSSYIEHYGDHRVEFNLKQECRCLMNAIIGSMSEYYNGAPYRAFDILSSAFLANDMPLMNLIPQIQYVGNLFRVRGKRSVTEVKDLFHVPFNERHKCGSYRYSIIGCPSIYFSTTLETALRETRISTQEYSAALFRPRTAIQCVDLSLTEQKLTLWERYSLVLFYPLIMACGLKVKKENLPFKPEYVIPQILFQIVAQYSNLDGISYCSSRYDTPDFRDIRMRNFSLIVPHDDIAKNYSQSLAYRFQVSAVMSPETGVVADVQKQLCTSELDDISI